MIAIDIIHICIYIYMYICKDHHRYRTVFVIYPYSYIFISHIYIYTLGYTQAISKMWECRPFFNGDYQRVRAKKKTNSGR
jgi:hypothetical protein